MRKVHFSGGARSSRQSIYEGVAGLLSIGISWFGVEDQR